MKIFLYYDSAFNSYDSDDVTIVRAESGTEAVKILSRYYTI